MLGRWGGDEFVVIGLAPPSKLDDRVGAVNPMRNRLEPQLIGTFTFTECSFDYLGASFGIVTVDPSLSSVQTVLKKADQLMYADKRARRAQQKLSTIGSVFASESESQTQHSLGSWAL